MNWEASVTFAIAVLGAVLGIFSTWQQLSKDRVKLRVRPVCVFELTRDGPSAARLAIHVLNLSAFPITVSDVGLVRRTIRKPRMSLTSPILLDGKEWPRKLEPRESVTAHFGRDLNSARDLHLMTRAYATTMCGVTTYGVSPALKDVVRKCRQG